MTIFGGFCSFCIVRYIFLKLLNKIRNYPPGPVGYPLFGSLIKFVLKPHKFLIDIPNKYGSIAYVQLLASNNIFISDQKILRQLYQTQKIIGRPSITVNKTKSWAEHQSIKESFKRRKWVSDTVYNATNTSFILNKTKLCLNEYIEQEMNKYTNNNKLWYPADFMNYIAFNQIFCAVFDHVLDFNDSFRIKYSKLAHKLSHSALAITLFLDVLLNNYVPCPVWLKKKISWNIRDEMDKIIIDWMNNHGFIVDVDKNIIKRTENDNNNNKIRENNLYIDFLIEKLEKNEINVKQILSDIIVILAGGVDTTSSVTEYGFILLAKFPKIQEMVYNELIAVIAQNNLKEFDFKILNKLPIFKAFIYELLRISCVAATAVPHFTNKDHIINVDGNKMIIPKNTMCHTNAYFMHKYMDWNDDNNNNNNKILDKSNDNIHLEYWLDENNNFKMNDNFVMFGVGKRDCAGRGLAMKSLFATIGLMITRYRFKWNHDRKDKNIAQSWGVVSCIYPKIPIFVEKR